jgi:hypothetical protein
MVENNSKKQSPFALTEQDIAALERRYINPETARLNDIYRVDDVEGAGIVGYTFRGTDGSRFCGLIIPNYRVEFLNPRSHRLRRDYPDLEPRTDGKPGLKEKGKYLWAAGSRSQFYYPFGNKREHLTDTSVAAYFIEGEFKAISLKRVLTGTMHESLVIGLYGAHNWKGTTGKTRDANGRREDIHGPVNDFEDIEWNGREVVICRDANWRTNPQVNSGMRELAAFLHTLGAVVFYADTPDIEDVNGLDDLAGLHGPEAVLDVISAAYPAIKPIKTEREKLSPEERKRQADFLRESASLNTEALAADVLGSRAAKRMLQLWAEAGLSDEAVRLLLAWEALGEGRESFDYHYADLYPLLYKCDGSEFEQAETGGRILKSSCRKRLKERIERLEKEQEAIGLTFAYHTPGKLDEMDNLIPSHVDLYSRSYVAEVMILAESLPGYTRSKKAARASAYKKFVSEKSGVAYRKKPPKRINRSKQIADGLQVIKGRLAATLKRMQLRGDSPEQQWGAIVEILPQGLIDFIIATSQGDLGVPSKPGVNVESKESDSARFSKTCTNPPNKERDQEIWDRLRERQQTGERVPIDLMDATDEMTAAILVEGERGAAL